MRHSPQSRGARPPFDIKNISLGGLLALTLLSMQATNAVTVDWTGTVANSCVVTVGSNGVGTYRTHALRPVPTTWFTPLPISLISIVPSLLKP